MKPDIFSEILTGETIVSVEGAATHSEAIIFTLSNGNKYKMFHDQDCCEEVFLSEVIGDIEDIVNTPILVAEKVVNDELNTPKDYVYDKWNDCHTWTFYKLRTIKGDVTLRWLGESNGYYSEEVDFVQIKGGAIPHLKNN